MKKLFSRVSIIAATAMLMVSCSDKGSGEPSVPSTPVGEDQITGEMELMTPTESKEFLSNTATDVLKKFRAADQREIIMLASYVQDEYGDLDMPEEFDIESDKDDEAVDAPVPYIKSLARALETYDASRAAAAAIVYTYTIDVEKMCGVYEPLATRWSKTKDSKDIIFKFKDEAGAECELKAVVDSYQDNTIEGEIYELYKPYYPDGSTPYGEENDTEQDVYKLRTPKNATITLTQGGKQLAIAKVNCDLNVADHKVNVVANVTVANIEAAASLNGTDNKVTMSSSLKVSGELIVSASAEVNGTHLCDYTYYRDKDLDDENVLMTLLQDGTATVSVLNKVRVDGKATYNRSIYKALNTYWDNDEFSSMADAEADVKKAVEALNKYVTADVRYNNTQTVQATLLWKYNFDSYGSYWWSYDIEPLIKFPSDGTTYSFDEYFEKGFASVTDQWENLIDSYEKVWDSAKK